MASALLAPGRHELHFAEPNVFMRKPPSNPNSNPRPPSSNPNPIPNPSLASFSGGGGGGYVTYHTAAYSRRELKDLKTRLVSELDQVRNLLGRIESWTPPSQIPRQHAATAHGERPAKQQKKAPPLASSASASKSDSDAKLRAAAMKKCGGILTKLRKHKKSTWFAAPVDVVALGLHDYHAIVKNPMDLGTVKSKLANAAYPSPDDFAADVRLAFHNALLYNPKGHEVHAIAGHLLAQFEDLFRPVAAWYDQERRHICAPPPPPPLPALPPPPAALVLLARVPKQAKPKARDANKRPMSMEEKHRLRAGLETLPEEKMAKVLEIVSRRNGDPEQLGDGEIELDIEDLDVETLWELDRFVTSCKKSASKALHSNSVPDALHGNSVPDALQGNTVPEETPTAAVPAHIPMVVEIGDSENDAPDKRSRLGDPVDEYVDIGDEMPSANYPPVEIEKDAPGVASSSSSSGSDSSSSTDSDSGSSTESDSDGGEAHSPA